MEAITYRIYNNASVAITPFDRANSGYKLLSPAPNTNAPAQINFSVSELSLAPGQSGLVTVTVIPPATNPLDHVMYGGYIQFHPNTTSAKALHIPYFGMVGRQRNMPIFEVNHEDFVIGVKNEEVLEYNITDTIVLKNNSWLVGLQYLTSVPTMIIKSELVLGQQVLGQVWPIQRYVKGGYSGNSFWDGQYFNAPFDFSSVSPIQNHTLGATEVLNVTDGTYHIRISALKLSGDMNNDNDWDSFMAGPFIVENIEK